MGKKKRNRSGKLNDLSSQLKALYAQWLQPEKDEQKANDNSNLDGKSMVGDVVDIKEIDSKSKNPAKSPSKAGESLNRAKTVDANVSYVCKECFKVFKYATGLKNHKCPEIQSLGLGFLTESKRKKKKKKKKTDCTKKTDDTRKTQIKKGSSDVNGADDAMETIDSRSTIDSKVVDTANKHVSHSKTVRFAEPLETIFDESFCCSHCSERFNHRRGYLEHMKKCIKTVNQEEEEEKEEEEGEEEEMTTPSLASHLDALYETLLNR